MKGRRKLRLTGSLGISLCLTGFFSFLVLGLINADNSFNSFTGRRNSISIFAFNDKGNGKYNIAVFGKNHDFDMQRIKEIIQDTGHLIKSVFNEEKRINETE